MDIFNIIILSVVEGITEFLPISSTGHLILTSNLLQIPQTEFLKTFQIAIQSGAVLAVVNLYRRKLINDKGLILKAITGLLPTLVIGLLLYSFIKEYLFESVQTISIALIVGGFVIIFLERTLKKSEKYKEKIIDDLSKVTYKQAFFTGLTQSLAVVPGVSRAAASIFGGMLFGMNRKTATEFSFILALPTIMAATGFDLVQTAPQFSASQIFQLFIGVAVSFIVALFTIKWLIKYVSAHTFTNFGWYRIIIGIIFLLLFI
jgi:undecaprenyl-diphosphatase